MFNLGWQELILILIIALVIFGPGKLPDVGKAIGKSLKEFKAASTDEEKPLTIDQQSNTPNSNKSTEQK